MCNKYKLVGIIGLAGLVPEFVYPIFKKDNEYYYEYGYDALSELEGFVKVEPEDVHKIRFIKDLKTNLTEELLLTKESKPIFGFYSHHSFVYFGFYDEIKEYVKKYRIGCALFDNELEEKFLEATGRLLDIEAV